MVHCLVTFSKGCWNAFILGIDILSASLKFVFSIDDKSALVLAMACPQARTKLVAFFRQYLQMHFVKKRFLFFDKNVMAFYSLVSNFQKHSSNVWLNGLALNRCQSFTWNKDVHYGINVFSGLNDFIYVMFPSIDTLVGSLGYFECKFLSVIYIKKIMMMLSFDG